MVQSFPVTDSTPSQVIKGKSKAISYREIDRAIEEAAPETQADILTSLAHASVLPREEECSSRGPLCQRCEVLPQRLSGDGSLHLSLPHTHPLGKVLAWLLRSHWKHGRESGLLRIDVCEGKLPQLLDEVAAQLTSVELRDTRALYQPAGHKLLLSDYFNSEPLASLSAKIASGWLLDLLREDRLTSHFQPIVRCDSGREVHGYECLMRGLQGEQIIMPYAILDAAKQADLLFQVDMAARRAAVQSAVRTGITSKIFINFTPNAIYDPEFCLQSTVRMVDDGGLQRDQLVFEVTEAERLHDLHHLVRIMNYYREKGFKVALDDIGSGYSSLQVLLELKPNYVKIDMGLIRNVDRDPAKAVVARKLIETCQELRIITLAEGIETKEEWQWVRKHGVDYVQGYLFGKPSAVPSAPDPTQL